MIVIVIDTKAITQDINKFMFPKSPLFQDLRIEGNLIPYLEFTGWKSSEDTNERWYVFERASGGEDTYLEIVLPRNPNASDLKIYLDNTVRLVAALNDETVEHTIQRIVFYDRDVLYVSNLETGEYNSITLKTAAQQIRNLKQIVNYAACSEQEPKPEET